MRPGFALVEHLEFNHVLGHVGKLFAGTVGNLVHLVQFEREASVGIAGVEVPNNILESVVCGEARVA